MSALAIVVWSPQVIAGTGRGTTVAILDAPIDPTADPRFGSCAPAENFAPRRSCRVRALENFGSTPVQALLQVTEHGSDMASAVLDVAPDANLVSLTVFDRSLEFGQPVLNQGALLAALTWLRSHASDDGVVVANLSAGWANELGAPCDDHPVAEAVRGLRRAGLPLVVATGNAFNQSLLPAPACVSAAVSVGATTDTSLWPGRDPDGVEAGMAVATFTDLNAMLDFVAGGTRAGTRRATGSSVAAAFVSGAIARIQSEERARGRALLSPDAIDDELRRYVQPRAADVKGSLREGDPRVFGGLDFTRPARTFSAVARFPPDDGSDARDPAAHGRGRETVRLTSTVDDSHRGTVRSAYLALDIAHPSPENLDVLLTAPDGRDVKVTLPSTRNPGTGRNLGGNFNGIVGATTEPGIFTALAGAPMSGTWTLSLGWNDEPGTYLSAALYLLDAGDACVPDCPAGGRGACQDDGCGGECACSPSPPWLDHRPAAAPAATATASAPPPSSVFRRGWASLSIVGVCIVAVLASKRSRSRGRAARSV
jgi:hypothetical protein